MDTFLRFLYEFLSQFFNGVMFVLKGIFNGIKTIFNIPEYIKVINEYKNDFSIPEWLLVGHHKGSHHRGGKYSPSLAGERRERVLQRAGSDRTCGRGRHHLFPQHRRQFGLQRFSVLQAGTCHRQQGPDLQDRADQLQEYVHHDGLQVEGCQVRFAQDRRQRSHVQNRNLLA